MHPPDAPSLEDLLDRIERDASLLDPQNFQSRLQALDHLDQPFPTTLAPRAASLSTKLEAASQRLYDDLRDRIRNGHSLLPILAPLIPQDPTGNGYDHLDDLLTGILRLQPPATPVTPLAPEMVFYQPTPARHLLRLLTHLTLTADDTLIDLGCGLGHLPLLTAMLTPAHALGIEIEPTYVAAAQHSGRELVLSRASFLHQDARTTDLSHGTFFYLYTPFTGRILADLLTRLRAEASRRSLRIASFGPITTTLATEPWLQSLAPPAPDIVTLFQTREA